MENNQELNEIKDSLETIKRSLRMIQNSIEEQEYRIMKIEGAKSVQEVAGVHVAPPPPPPPSTSAPKIVFNETFQIQPEVPPAIEYQPVVQPQKKEEIGMEEKIGGNWFAKIGIVALVLGITFFIKYAFDNGWISPWGRVLIGLAVGVALLVFGWKTIQKYFAYGQLMSGGGIAILYLSVYAAFDFYHLIGMPIAFIGMVMVTALGMFLSNHYNAVSLLIVSMLGGFATPFLISTGENMQIIVLSYITILDLAILLVSVFRKWFAVNIVGFWGTFITFMAWAMEHYTEDQLAVTFFFLTLFFLIYSISSVIYNLMKQEKTSGPEEILNFFAVISYFTFAYILLDKNYTAFQGFFTVLLAAYYFFWAFSSRRVLPEDTGLSDFFLAVGMGLVALAVPIQFDGRIVTVSWLIVSVILFLLGIRTKRKVVHLFATGIFAAAIFKLNLNDALQSYKTTFFLNNTFLVYLFSIGCSYVIAYLFSALKQDEEGDMFDKKGVVPTFMMVASVLTIWSVSREIGIYFTDYALIWPVFWIVYAFILFALDLRFKQRSLSGLGVFLFFGAIFNVFLLNETINLENRTFLLNKIFAVFSFTILASYILVYLLKNVEFPGGKIGFFDKSGAVPTFMLIASVLTIWSVSREIKISFTDYALIWPSFWIIYSGILFALDLWLKQRWLSGLGLILLFGSIFNAFFLNELVKIGDRAFLLNKVFAVCFFAILASYALAYLLKRIEFPDERVGFLEKAKFIALLIIFANVLTIFSVSQEISIFYGNKIETISSQASYQSKIYLDYRSEEKSESLAQIEKLKNQGSISLSLFWLFYAIVLVAIGFIGKYQSVRIGGLLLFLLAIFKLFFYDLWGLGRLYQIIIFIIFGAVLIAVSFAYNRYKDKLKEVI